VNALESLRYFIPETIVLAGAFLVLTLDLFLRPKKVLAALSILILIAAAFFSFSLPANPHVFSGFFHLDSMTVFFRLFSYGVVALTILISTCYRAIENKFEGEYYSLFLFLALALVLAAASANLLMIFLTIEFISILSYLLVGYEKKNERSKEASLKYLLFGSVASAMMLFGMSLVFGATGSLWLDAIPVTLAKESAFFAVALTGTLFILAGLGFKVSMAPFHLWAPDVYEGAPTPVTTFLTVGPKALGFAVLLRVLVGAFGWFRFEWGPVIALLAIITMTLGNVTAIAQTKMKRLLAYSSIAQAGYILMGVAAGTVAGIESVLYYLVAYALTNIGVFTIAIVVANQSKNDDIESFRGLSRRAPGLAAAMVLFLLSLAGLPPLAGFVAKFSVFAAALQVQLYTLALAAALNSTVAAFYYFKIVRLMYLVPSDSEQTVENPAALSFVIILLLAGTIALGLFPAPLMTLAHNALPL